MSRRAGGNDVPIVVRQTVRDVLTAAKRHPLESSTAAQLALGRQLSSLVHSFPNAGTEDAKKISTWLLSNEAFVSVLLRVLAVALRPEPEARNGDGRTNGFCEQLRRAAAFLAGRVMMELKEERKSGLVDGFGRALLAIGSFECYSARLAQVSETARRVILAPTVDGAQQGLAAKCIAEIAFTGALMQPLVDGCVHSMLQGQQRTVLQATGCLSALRSSGVLEHSAQAVLLGLQLAGGMREDRLRRFLSDFDVPMHINLLTGCVMSLLVNDEAKADLHQALSGRCMRHLGLSLGVAALSAADGGPTYGMPAALLAALRAVVVVRERAGPMNGPHPAAGKLHENALLMMAKLLPLGSRDPPPGRRVSLELLCRMLNVANASAEAWEQRLGIGSSPHAGAAAPSLGPAAAGASATGSVRSGQAAPAEPAPPPRPLLDAESVSDVVAAGVTAAANLLASADGDRGGGARVATAGAEVWGVALFTAFGVAAWSAEQELDLLAECIMSAVLSEEESGGGFAPFPSLQLATALAGGLLPFLECLLRRAGEDPGGPTARLALRLLPGGSSVEPLLLSALPHGEPRQAAALVATLGKLLRRLEPALLALLTTPAGSSSGGDDVGPEICLLDSVLFANYVITTKGLYALSGSTARAGPAGPTEAVRRLSQVVSFAGHEALPVLARLVQDTARALLLPGAAGDAAAEYASGGTNALRMVLMVDMLASWMLWLPFLITETDHGDGVDGQELAGGGGDGGHGSSGGSAGGSPAAVPRPPALRSGGWRPFLLERVRPVSMLGAALRIMMHPRVRCASVQWRITVMSTLAQALHQTASALPNEIAEAAAAAAAAAAAPAPPRVASPPTGHDGAGALLEHGEARCDGGSDGDFRCDSNAAHVRAAQEPPGGPAAGPSAAGDQVLSYWPPDLLLDLSSELRALDIAQWADVIDALAKRVEGREAVDVFKPIPGTSVSSMLLPPGAAFEAGLLRACANPGCTNLGGDSEAELSLKACARCGAVEYCCRDCQTAHWRAEHKAACRGRPS